MNSFFLSWGMMILSVLFNVFGIFVIKTKLNECGPIQIDSFKKILEYFLLLIKSPLVVFGAVLFFAAPFLFTVALSRMPLSVAYPAQLGLNFLILILLGLIFLGESLTIYKVIGMALVLAGIYFLSK